MASNAVLVVVGVAVSGYTGYALLQMTNIAQLESELKSTLNLIESEKKKITRNSSEIGEQEKRISALSKSNEVVTQAISELDIQLEQARKELKRIESLKEQKVGESTKFLNDISTSQRAIYDLKTQSDRAKESVTLGMQTLGLLKSQVEEARLQFNPLNHPKVKELMKK